MKSIVTIALLLFTLSVVANDLELPIFNEYVDQYIVAISSKDRDKILELTSSKNIDIHTSNLRVLNEVKGSQYKLDVSPYVKADNGMTAFFLNASDGKCSFVAEPTHELKINWSSTSEQYTPGHACHSIDVKSASITLFVQSMGKKVVEVSACSSDYKVPSNNDSDATKVGLGKQAEEEIKAWLISQDSFSSIKSMMHVSKNYGLSYKQANLAIESLCQEL